MAKAWQVIGYIGDEIISRSRLLDNFPDAEWVKVASEEKARMSGDGRTKYTIREISSEGELKAGKMFD